MNDEIEQQKEQVQHWRESFDNLLKENQRLTAMLDAYKYRTENRQLRSRIEELTDAAKRHICPRIKHGYTECPICEALAAQEPKP